MVNENIDRAFFGKDVPLEKEVVGADGKVRIQEIGTINLLRNWLGELYRKLDTKDMSDEVVSSLKRIRKLRQEPAHAIKDDEYDLDIPHQQDDLVLGVLKSLTLLRRLLMSHPAAQNQYRPPEWLDGDKIVVY
jgi:hypothetical protein